MKTEYLIYFTEQAAYHDGKFIGYMPPHYMMEKTKASRDAAIACGGKDVSDNQADWCEWEREQNLAYMHG